MILLPIRCRRHQPDFVLLQAKPPSLIGPQEWGSLRAQEHSEHIELCYRPELDASSRCAI
jgi:hypothetical protein